MIWVTKIDNFIYYLKKYNQHFFKIKLMNSPKISCKFCKNFVSKLNFSIHLLKKWQSFKNIWIIDFSIILKLCHFFNRCIEKFDLLTQSINFFWNLLESFGIFWNLLESFEIFWNLLEFFGIFWNLLRNFWNLLDSFGIFSSLSGAIRNLVA